LKNDTILFIFPVKLQHVFREHNIVPSVIKRSSITHGDDLPIPGVPFCLPSGGRTPIDDTVHSAQGFLI
jgi:hypothetical protein